MRTARCLIFEDNEISGMVAARDYHNDYVRVSFDWVRTVKEARLRMETGDYDVGIFDLIPDPRGDETIQDTFAAIKDLSEKGHIILVLSGADSVHPDIRDKCIVELGADDYLNKIRAGESRSAYIERILCAIRRRERDKRKPAKHNRKKG